MLELLALVLTVEGWTTQSTTMAVSEKDGIAHISGIGSCYIDLTSQALPSQINGVSFMVKGKGKAEARIMMDTEGTTYAVVTSFTAGDEAIKVSLDKSKAGPPIRMAPIMPGLPERLMLFIDANEPVELEVWGVETW
ncbi:MAG: hypothetical protein ABIM74_08480 [candidate division WOR-3 bacterium]